MEPRTAAATACGIPSERDAALADRTGRALEALIDGTRPVRRRDRRSTGAGGESAPRILRPHGAWQGHFAYFPSCRTDHAAGGRVVAGVADASGPASRRRPDCLPKGRLGPPRPRRGHPHLAPRDGVPPPRGTRRTDRARPGTRPAIAEALSDGVARRQCPLSGRPSRPALCVMPNAISTRGSGMAVSMRNGCAACSPTRQISRPACWTGPTRSWTAISPVPS